MADANVLLGGLSINGLKIIETNIPTAKNVGDAVQKGEQTVSKIARGLIADTGIDFTNKNITHICDASLAIKFDVLQAKSALKQLLQNVRDAIMSLFSGDALSPIITQLKEIAKWVAAKIKALSKVIKAIADVAKIAALIAIEIPKIIAWIQNLPALIARELTACLGAFTSLLTTAEGIVVGTVTSTVSSIYKSVGDLSSQLVNQNITAQAAVLANSAPNIPSSISFKPFV